MTRIAQLTNPAPKYLHETAPLRVARIIQRSAGVLLASAMLCTLAPQASAETYRWVDDQGVVHFGDNVPPQYSKHEREMLNEAGIALKRLPAEPTAAEIRAQEAAREAELARKREAQVQRKYDQSLLHTYLSVEDIESLRDDRLETLAARLRLTEHAIRNLRSRMIQLEDRATKYNYPYDPNSTKKPMPDKLADDLLETVSTLTRREKDTETIVAEREAIRARFDADIARFKLLKGEDETSHASAQ